MSQQARTVNQHANRNDMGFAHNVPIRAVYVGPIEHFVSTPGLVLQHNKHVQVQFSLK